MERTFDLTNCKNCGAPLPGYHCKNCGAPLPGYHCKCEYCGTNYFEGIRDIGKIDEWDETDEVVLFRDGEEYLRLIRRRH